MENPFFVSYREPSLVCGLASRGISAVVSFSPTFTYTDTRDVILVLIRILRVPLIDQNASLEFEWKERSIVLGTRCSLNVSVLRKNVTRPLILLVPVNDVGNG